MPSESLGYVSAVVSGILIQEVFAGMYEITQFIGKSEAQAGSDTLTIQSPVNDSQNSFSEVVTAYRPSVDLTFAAQHYFKDLDFALQEQINFALTLTESLNPKQRALGVALLTEQATPESFEALLKVCHNTHDQDLSLKAFQGILELYPQYGTPSLGSNLVISLPMESMRYGFSQHLLNNFPTDELIVSTCVNHPDISIRLASRIHFKALISEDLDSAKVLFRTALESQFFSGVPYSYIGGVALRALGKPGIDAFEAFAQEGNPDLDSILIPEIRILGRDGMPALRTIALNSSQITDCDRAKSNLDLVLTIMRSATFYDLDNVVVESFRSPSDLHKNWALNITMDFIRAKAEGPRYVLNRLRYMRESLTEILNAIENARDVTLADNMCEFLNECIRSDDTTVVLSGLKAINAHPETFERCSSMVNFLTSHGSGDIQVQAVAVMKVNLGKNWEMRQMFRSAARLLVGILEGAQH